MKTSKRIMVCWATSFALSCFAQLSGERSMTEKSNLVSRMSITPVRVAIANFRVEGERRDSAILREESFIRLQYAIENKEYNDQRARKNQIAWWNQARADFLKRGDINNANRYPEKPFPVFPSCALRIDKAVIDWVLAPSINIFRVLDWDGNKPVRGEGWSVGDLGCKPVLELSKPSMDETSLEETPLMIYGRIGKTLIDRLGVGTYECEVSLDTAKATMLNVADTGIVSQRFIFYIKEAESDGEKWWLERPVILEAESKGDWTTVLSLTEDALKKHTSSVSVVIECLMYRGNALRSVEKNEEALVAYGEALKIGGRNLPYSIDANIKDAIYQLRQKLKGTAEAN